jgi:hypothetical protein
MYRRIFTLICLAFSSFIAGCGGGLAGGGGSYHTPPKAIRIGQPTALSVDFKAWGAGAGKLSTRYKNVLCHYRIVGSEVYSEIPMTPTSETPERLTVEGVIPPMAAKPGDQLEYYIDEMFDGHYNRQAEKPVPFE